jgi:copper chaperone
MPMTLNVSNIHCEACARRVTAAIETAEPAAHPKVDVGSGKVTLDTASDMAAILAALAEAGYPASVSP